MVKVIAELSCNHNQDYQTAIDHLDAAKQAGADAVKIQMFTPDTMTVNSKKKDFLVDHEVWGGQSFYDLYKKAAMPRIWYKSLKEYATKIGIILFPSVFSIEDLDFVENNGSADMYKVASFEITDIPLIEAIAKTGKTIILSTGIAYLSEIAKAIETINKYHNNIILLKCISQYPANIKDINIKELDYLRSVFNIPVGISDHTPGDVVPIAAAVVGAVMIEKHFIIDKRAETPDAFFSLDFMEFANMTQRVKLAASLLGDRKYSLTKKQKNNRKYSRSVLVASPIKKGEVFTKLNIKVLRPGIGLSPERYFDVIGKTATKTFDIGDPITSNSFK